MLQGRHGDTIDVLLTPALGVLAGVGTLLWRRRPGNPIGPILLVLALLVTASVAAEGVYAGCRGPGAVVLRLLAWFDQWVIYLWFGLVGILLPLLFPDGKLPSRRWRRVLWAGAAMVVLSVLGTAFGSPGSSRGAATDPATRWRSAGRRGRRSTPDSRSAGRASRSSCSLALASVVVRFRRARGVERQQLKWFGYAIGLLLTGLAASAISEATGWELLGDVGWTVFLISLIFALPLAIAIAILRYRLYDIDLVIRRTLVYGALTVDARGAPTSGSVLLVGLAVGESDFAVAASTLAVAALFRPARARIQAAVDRRFYRRRYDAARTLEAFGGAAARRARPRGARRRPARRGARHGAARPRVALAQERRDERGGSPGRCWRSTSRSPLGAVALTVVQGRRARDGLRRARVRGLRGRRRADRAAPARATRSAGSCWASPDLALRGGRGSRIELRRGPAPTPPDARGRVGDELDDQRLVHAWR